MILTRFCKKTKHNKTKKTKNKKIQKEPKHFRDMPFEVLEKKIPHMFNLVLVKHEVNIIL